LMRLISLKRDNKKFVLYLILFYLAIFSLTAFNNWFSALIIVGIIFVSLIGFLFSTSFNTDTLPYRKSLYIIISCIPLYYCISFYIYPPSRSTWRIVNIWRKKLTMLDSRAILLGIAMSLIATLALILLMLRDPIMSALKNYATEFSKKIHASKTYRPGVYIIIGFVLIIYMVGVYILTVSSNFLSFSPFIWTFFNLI